ncbi:hypothetical protein ASPWEDRAFT_549422 [Aspergillus wentii DTO 134E9]|uniref:Anaphase-promoting complex subunit 4 WD40 domain-containing protein n=1 Tax=Aspergillus wentii DTO 134E9 TaxID=1073089 RepID=A0A1L9RGC6_ASPWE|nr:uncharacterized protein ASPWEDRAFT_549422 [Aspergillus wentii DTO 134E9]KAI9927707.1 hypothetical protein MW887_002559 [Aspergillus wentii]OJJ33918.1 hypothetical protein ASPWEDRAFT_549422 [Aspergillus wentii DTO 134E9]
MASDSPQKPQSATTIFLDQPPSCLQFCPEAPNFFVVGTYFLSESKDEEENITQTKTGSLQLWEIDPVENKLSLIQRIPIPYAVFDLHFHPRNPSILAIAGSTGSAALFRVSTSDPASAPVLTPLWTLPVHEDQSIPALFLAWAPQNWCSKRPQTDAFAVTFSDSRTAVFGTSGKGDGGDDIAKVTEGEIVELGRFDARQCIEVWFVALGMFADESGAEIPYMFTGNDFGALHTRRFGVGRGDENDEDEDEEEPLSPLLLDHDDRARHHTAGVTSIIPLPLPLVDGAPVLLTGSYDEYLRVYHATRRGEVLAEVCLGGGVWRLQMLSEENVSGSGWRFLVLASCMHAGTRIVRITQGGDEWQMEVLAEFTEHQSMNYASDVWKGAKEQGGNSETLCVSSSFYDKRVCIWRASV